MGECILARTSGDGGFDATALTPYIIGVTNVDIGNYTCASFEVIKIGDEKTGMLLWYDAVSNNVNTPTEAKTYLIDWDNLSVTPINNTTYSGCKFSSYQSVDNSCCYVGVYKSSWGDSYCAGYYIPLP